MHKAWANLITYRILVFFLSLLYSFPSPTSIPGISSGNRLPSLSFRVCFLLSTQGKIHTFSSKCLHTVNMADAKGGRVLLGFFNTEDIFELTPSGKEELSSVDSCMCSIELFIGNFSNFKLFHNFILCKCSMMLRDIFPAYPSARIHLSFCVEGEFANLQPTLMPNEMRCVLCISFRDISLHFYFPKAKTKGYCVSFHPNGKMFLRKALVWFVIKVTF